MKVTRRGVLVGAAAGGGLLVAWSLTPRRYATPLAPEPGEAAFDAWLTIGRDGVVTVAVPQLEMGQGVTTLLPQIVAMELGADWRQVAVEPAPISGAYANLPLAARWAEMWRPAWAAPAARLADDPGDLLLERWAQAHAFTATAEGTALAAYELPCREAGASARAMLQMAAADRWDVKWEECQTQAGLVTHSDRRLGFGELAEAAARYSPPSPPPLRPDPPAEPAQAGDLAGDALAYPRLDLPSKVDGSYLFAGDVRLPDMVFAAILHGPKPRAELLPFDEAAGARQPGFLGVVKGRRFLAALGETWWAAEQALGLLAPRFGVTDPLDSAALEQALDEALRVGEAHRVSERGAGAGAGAAGDAHLVSARYDVAPALHTTLETASATARLKDGRLELWIASQAPEQARRAAAKAIGLGPGDVVLYPMPAGGSFDRRLEHDHAIEAAIIAREAAQSHGGRPVQLLWSRWQEQLASHPRMPAAALLSARLAADGQIAALSARIACPPSAREFGRRLFANSTSWDAIDQTAGEADPLALEGALPPYAIADVAIDHVPARLALATGRMRANAHGLTCFMVESFVDELATAQQQEPLAYRVAMLGGDPRLVACLQRAARLARWDGGARGTGQGLACHVMGAGEEGGGGRIALIASAEREGARVRVKRLSAAVDIGRVVNRDIALQQIEGGLVYGLGLALGSAVAYDKGLPAVARLAQLNLPTLADCPPIDIDLVASDAPSFDPGEIGVPPVAPAIANALFSAHGIRLRRLPLLSAAA